MVDWEKKAASIARRNRENKENENLTEEQHDALILISEARHDLHTDFHGFFLRGKQ